MEESKEKSYRDNLAQEIQERRAVDKEEAKEAEKKHQEVEEQKAIREKIRMMIVDGEPVKEIKEYFYNIQRLRRHFNRHFLRG